MNVQTTVIVGVAILVVGGFIVFLMRKKNNVSGSVGIRGIAEGRFKAGNNPRDAAIRDSKATEDATATAPQGSATIERTKGRNLSATAGEPQNPKS